MTEEAKSISNFVSLLKAVKEGRQLEIRLLDPNSENEGWIPLWLHGEHFVQRLISQIDKGYEIRIKPNQ